MTSNTLSNRLRLLRRQVKHTRGWGLLRFAKELGYSASYVKLLERGTQPLSRGVLEKMRRIEQDLAYISKEICETDAQTRDWLLMALEARRGELTNADRKRIRGLLE